MKLAVEFPSIAYREGGAKVLELAKAIEDMGYDEIAVFDHVVMGYPTETRQAPIYPPAMPIIEAFMLMAYCAAATQRVSLSTEVLVLPQRQPVLVAKQVASLDTLSGGRVRLGVGIGWQEAEYDVLGESFTNRGKRMDEAIAVMRAYWGDSRVDLSGRYYPAEAIAMEPKPPQGAALPIWIGGTSQPALRRTARLGDGWMGGGMGDDEARQSIVDLRRFAEEYDRDPAAIGLQMMLASPPRDAAGKTFYSDADRVVRRAEQIKAMGFEWTALNATAIFQAGARSVNAIIDQLALLHGRLRDAVG